MYSRKTFGLVGVETVSLEQKDWLMEVRFSEALV
jgi:hypothetical protein